MGGVDRDFVISLPLWAHCGCVQKQPELRGSPGAKSHEVLYGLSGGKAANCGTFLRITLTA